ncbi:hypothetical protein CLU79DRAFT_730562 [Phycomyces nitens]|nr:hypothetical protein CLU79DRAFT_730562 [Phycomyces nitens]
MLLEKPKNEDVRMKETHIVAKFHDYFSSCLSNFQNNMDVDRCFNDLLCISSVLVLQRREKYESLPMDRFPPFLLKTLHQDVVKSSLPSVLDPALFMSIKGILKMYHDNEITNLATRQKLINLAMEKVGAEQSRVLLSRWRHFCRL